MYKVLPEVLELFYSGSYICTSGCEILGVNCTPRVSFRGGGGGGGESLWGKGESCFSRTPLFD